MSQFKRFLVVIDPTVTAQPALERAAWLAAATGAELRLLICYYNEYLSGDRLFDSRSLAKARDEIVENQQKHLDELANELREKGIDVSTVAVWDHPLYEGIVRQAVASNADLVVKDTHHHDRLTRALLTNTDWNLIRSCPMPLWLVKPGAVDNAPAFLAAIDPTHQHDKPAALDDRLIGIGKQLASATAGTLHAFHAYDPRIAVATATANAYIPVSLPLDEIEQEMHDERQKRFSEITKFHDIPDAQAHLASGLTHEELPAKAEELGATVVIMGAIARNRMKRLFIGSTAERTLEHLPCDMLIVKPDGFESPVTAEAHEAA